MTNYYTFPKTCLTCKKDFMGRTKQKYCCLKCRDKHYGINSEFKGIPTGTIGAIQELRVSVDLLGKGYEVFRALSPSCSCDLLVCKNGKEFRIEVTTGYTMPNNKILHPKKEVEGIVLAVVANGKIYYSPQI